MATVAGGKGIFHLSVVILQQVVRHRQQWTLAFNCLADSETTYFLHLTFSPFFGGFQFHDVHFWALANTCCSNGQIGG